MAMIDDMTGASSGLAAREGLEWMVRMARLASRVFLGLNCGTYQQTKSQGLVESIRNLHRRCQEGLGGFFELD